MSTIDLHLSERAQRRLAQLRIMCAMIFPDDPKLRAGAEITYWTQFAEMFSSRVVEQYVSATYPVRSTLDLNERPEVANSEERTTRRFLANLLAPYGGRHDVILQLADSPSLDELNREWAARWWDIFYTGKALSLIGSIHQHHPELGASFNKAMFILRKTEARRPASEFRQMGESNLHKAWAKFRPVVHLCAAYFRTESDYYKEEITHDLREYWKRQPALFNDDVFRKFLLFAKAAEDFATTYCAHGRRQPLVPRKEMLALPEGVIDPTCSLPGFERLTETQFAALNSYEVPQ